MHDQLCQTLDALDMLAAPSLCVDNFHKVSEATQMNGET